MKSKPKITSAIILAGGKGERLMPLTATKPKPMVEIAGEPMIVRIIKWVSSYGINNIILAINKNGDIFRQEIGDGRKYGVKIKYSIETKPLSTGGAVKLASKHPFIRNEKNILVLNGDSMSDAKLDEMFDLHIKNKADLTTLAVKMNLPWDVLRIGKDEKVNVWQERPKISCWFYSGVCIYSRPIFRYLPDIGEQEPAIQPLCDKYKFLAYQSNAFFRAVDTLKDRREAENYFLSKK